MSNDTPGYQLGINLAFVTRDLMDRPNDMDLLKQMELISASYNNFSRTGLPDFDQDFARGLETGRKDMRIELGVDNPDVSTDFATTRDL